MAVKLLSNTCSKKVPSWVLFRACSKSSISSAVMPETEQILSNSSDFESKIRFLRSDLRPNSLIRVLDVTQDLDSSLKLFKWASFQYQFRHSADTYYRIISKLGFAGNVDDMEGFCKEMVRERCPGTEEALVALIDLFVKNGRLSEALRILVTLNYGNYKLSISTYNVLLGALVEEKKDFSDVLLVYKEMVKSHIAPSTDTLNYLLEALFDSDRVDIALDQFRRMKMKRCNPNSKTFEIVLSRLVIKDRVDESIHILNEMLDLNLELESSFYSCIMPLYCGINKLEVALRLFNMMESSKLSPDFRVYESLIKCLCENQLFDDAKDLVKEMIDVGLTPSNDVLLHVIGSLCKLKRFEKATAFLEDKLIWGSDPSNALLKGYCNVGNFFLAKNIFADMLQRGSADTMSWNIIICWLSENTKNLREVSNFLSKMIVSSYVPDCATYSALVVCNCRFAKYEDALALFHHASSESRVLDSSSYAELIRCLCQHSMIKEAYRVFNYMYNNGYTLQLQPLNMFIKGLCANGDIDQAIMALISTYHLGTCSSTETYNSIMLALLKAGKINNLLIALSRMIVEGCSMDCETYAILIESMISIGCTKDCIFLFNLMVSEGQSLNSKALNNILSCFAKSSQLHTILVSLDTLVQNQEAVDSEIFNLLIKGLWGEGYKTVVSRLLDDMLEKGWVPDTTTHGLLMGSVRDREGKLEESEDSINAQDNVSDILAEGLGGG